MRIAILWIQLTGYLNACLRELASRNGIELFVAHRVSRTDSPFSSAQFGWINDQLSWRPSDKLKTLAERLEKFNPDVIITAGWTVPAYRKAARAWKSRALRIMTMDNCWAGSVAQHIGCLTADFFVHGLADAIWVPGERQVDFARKLKFRQNQILRGQYCCDYSAFSWVLERRLKERAPFKKAFIFVGRIVKAKGIATMAEAYRLYRGKVRDPWPLVCYGKGPLDKILAAEPGVFIEGFVQPEDLPSKFADAACLVLPSSFEPWALVVHEAAAAGLLVLASEAVGSVPHLVQSGYNGFVFSTGDAEELAQLMQRVSLMDDMRLEAMSAASASLARQYTPHRWADTLVEYANDHLVSPKAARLAEAAAVR